MQWNYNKYKFFLLLSFIAIGIFGGASDEIGDRKDCLRGKNFYITFFKNDVRCSSTRAEVIVFSTIDNTLHVKYNAWQEPFNQIQCPDTSLIIHANEPTVIPLFNNTENAEIYLVAEKEVLVYSSLNIKVLSDEFQFNLNEYNFLLYSLSEYRDVLMDLLDDDPTPSRHETITGCMQTTYVYRDLEVNITNSTSRLIPITKVYNIETYPLQYVDTIERKTRYRRDGFYVRDVVDSIIYVHVNLLEPNITATETVVACGQYRWMEIPGDITQQIKMESGTYTYCKNEGACEECSRLVLTINQPPIELLYPEVCPGGSYVYHRRDGTDTTITDDNKAYTVEKWPGNSMKGECDTIVEVYLTYRNLIGNDIDTICSEATHYIWKGGDTWESDIIYNDISKLQVTRGGIRTSDGQCDSSVIRTLIRRKPIKGDTIAVVCKTGQYYSWYGKNRWVSDANATYSYTLKEGSSCGCDSTITLHFKVPDSEKPKRDTITETICHGSSYKWTQNKKEYTPDKFTIYADTLKYNKRSPFCDCDSFIHELHLNVLPKIAKDTTATFCENTVYYWKGHFFVNDANVCDKDTNVRNYCKGGDYYDTLKYSRQSCIDCNKKPCDSIIHLHLVESYDLIDVLDTFVCPAIEADSFTWVKLPNGEKVVSLKRDTSFLRWYDDPSQPDSMAHTLEGCNYGMRIDIRVVKYVNPDPTLMYDDPYRDTITLVQGAKLEGNEVSYVDWGMYHLDREGDFCQVFTATIGCDSAVCRHVRVISNTEALTIANVCAGESYLWKPDTARPARKYNIKENIWKDTIIVDTVVLKNNWGKDSICALHLTGHPKYNVKNKRVIQSKEKLCTGDTLYINGRKITEGGRYVFYLKTIHGCDSVVNLTVNEYASFDTTIIDSLCRSQTYSDFGFNIDTFGDFVFSYITEHGCDSIYRIRLSEIVDTVFIEDTICQDEPYIFNKDTLWESGNYVDTFFLECKTITYLDLTVIPKAKLSAYNIEECADEPVLNIPFDYISIAHPKMYSILLSDMALSAGFKNVIHASLYGDEEFVELPLLPLKEKRKYIQPDVYTGTLHVWNAFCDSVSTSFSISLLYPTGIVKQMWNDMLLVTNSEYNGGYTFSDYTWFCDGEEIPNYNESYLYYTHDIAMGKEYVVYLTRTSDKHTIPTCPFIPEDKVDWILPKSSYITVTPTWITKNNPVVSVTTNTSGNYSIFDMAGKKIGGGSFVPCEHNELLIEIPNTFPVCLIFFRAIDGTTHIEKIYIR